MTRSPDELRMSVEWAIVFLVRDSQPAAEGVAEFAVRGRRNIQTIAAAVAASTSEIDG